MRRFYNLKGKATALAALAGAGSKSRALRAAESFCLFVALVLFSVEPGRGAALAIEPMTVVNKSADTGYFQDPYPVHKAPSNSPDIQLISGTTQELLSGSYPLQPQGFKAEPVNINRDPLQPGIDKAGATFTNYQNLNMFQTASGEWHMVLAIGVIKNGAPHYWTVIVHAHPDVEAKPGLAPTQWTADTVLSGSFATFVDGNYDCKYFEDQGQLYLVYVKNLKGNPVRNGIVIQPMSSPTQPVPVAPTLLLQPNEHDGGFNSELYANTGAKVIEVANLKFINNKYALAYSTGAYETAGYKAGVAWSDTLLPEPGRTYRKVLMKDTKGVWGKPGHLEVRYLLQSQEVDWPNFCGNQVIGPGVPSLNQTPGGTRYLFFGGFAPNDTPPIGGGAFQASHRRPYYLGLKVSVPAGARVNGVSDAELASWITPEAG
jgi:hypothetical protein